MFDLFQFEFHFLNDHVQFVHVYFVELPRTKI